MRTSVKSAVPMLNVNKENNMYALIIEDGWTGRQEIISRSKSFDRLYKLLNKYIKDGYNEACLNIVEL